jgi:Zn-finger nucleic acid-binding protein
MQAVLRTLTRCLVCGFAEVRTDEVVDRGIVFLAECPRCEHRWTSRAPLEPVRTLSRAGAGARAREVASAA